jgi:hypothetical protein
MSSLLRDPQRGCLQGGGYAAWLPSSMTGDFESAAVIFG